MGQTIAEAGGGWRRKRRKSIGLICTFEKKSPVNLDKRFRLYPRGSTGLA